MTKGRDIELLKAAKWCQILKTIDVSEILTLEISKDAMLWMRLACFAKYKALTISGLSIY
jgi:hypothetical protein